MEEKYCSFSSAFASVAAPEAAEIGGAIWRAAEQSTHPEDSGQLI
jgi:hypothetical protein